MDAKTFSRWADTAGSETGRQSKTGQSAAGAMAQDRRNKVRDDAPTRDHPEVEGGARRHGESGARRHGGAGSGRAEAAPAAGADEAGSEGSAVWDSSDVAEVQEMEPIGPRASPAAERPLERLEEAAALGEALLEAAAAVAPAATASSERPAPTCQETDAFVSHVLERVLERVLETDLRTALAPHQALNLPEASREPCAPPAARPLRGRARRRAAAAARR